MSPCPFPTTITTTPRVPPKRYMSESDLIALLEFELAYYDSALHYSYMGQISCFAADNL